MVNALLKKVLLGMFVPLFGTNSYLLVGIVVALISYCIVLKASFQMQTCLLV